MGIKTKIPRTCQGLNNEIRVELDQARMRREEVEQARHGVSLSIYPSVCLSIIALHALAVLYRV